ncbi:MAG: histidine triad nucleotide-binding protein, partial [Anaerolineae bacterium]|nr:histidine triad nucleotide-binding protein [Anaerolineae bacterium]
SRGELPATFVYQDDAIMAFHDISPSAPTHILIVPRQHILNTTEVNEQNAPLLGKMVQVAAQVARDQNVEASGYRLIMNTGQNGGQVVMHLHMHLLGGRRLGRLG